MIIMSLEKKVSHQMCTCSYLCLVMVCHAEDVSHGHRLTFNHHNHLSHDVYY